MLSSIIIKVKGLGMRKNTLVLYFACLCTITLASCSTPHVFDNTPSGPAQSAPRDNIPLSLENPEFWQGSPEAVWARIQQQPLDKLTASQYATTDQINVGWIKLAIISKRYSADTNDLTQQLIAWRTDFPSHPGNNIFPTNPTLNSIASAPVPKNIALLLPLSGKLAGLGSAVRNGFLNAYYSQLAKSSYQQSISFIDTNSTVSIGALYQQAVAKGADFVVGPLTKDEVQKMMSSSSFSVPTLALNYTDLWFGTLPSNLYEFGLSPLDEAAQIADKAAQTGHSHAIIIAPDTDWGQRVVKKLSDRWKQDGGTISDTFYFSSKSNLTKDIAALLHVDTKEDNTKSHDETANDRATLEQQRRQDFDVIFLLAPPQSARQIVPLLRFYYVDKTAIFSTSIAYGGYAQPQKDFDLNGVTFLDTPWVLSGKSSDSNPEANRLFAVGHDAYLISHNISRFTQLVNFPVYGQTGALTLTPQKQFYRRLAWAQFHAGHP
jgi:outer membrane PBP1 activator LpoA protein